METIACETINGFIIMALRYLSCCQNDECYLCVCVQWQYKQAKHCCFIMQNLHEIDVQKVLHGDWLCGGPRKLSNGGWAHARDNTLERCASLYLPFIFL